MGTSAGDTRVIDELRRANAELQIRLDERTAELHEKNERYALVGEAVAEGVYDWNIEQNTLFVSPRLMEMFGFEGPDLKSEAWLALVHEADRAAYRGALRDCFKGNTPKVGCEYRILLQSGEYRWVEDHGLPIRNAAGRAIRLVGAVSNVTARKRAEETLRDTNRLNEALLGDLNAVIDTIDYGVLFMGPDLRARVINRAFRQMWGIPDAFIATRPTMADLINFNRHTALYGVPEAAFEPFIARRVEAIQAGNIDPVEMRRGDGKILRYQGVVLPDGGRLLTYFDITESKRLEAELRESLAQQIATAEVLGVINASPGDLAPVFDAILEKAHRLCGATQGTLQLYDGTHFRAVATHGLRPDWAEAQFRPRPPTNEADHALLRGARLVHYPDLAAVASQYPDDARMRSAVASGVRTILRVPFRREATLLGYISAYREEVKPFSEQEIALLESFAQQAVIAMENARLLTETREALEQQTATAEVLQVINSSPGDLAPVFDALLEKATGLCNAAFGILSLYQGDDRHHVVSMRGVPEPVAALLKEPVRLGPETGMGRLVRGERIVHIVDAADDDAYRQGNPVRRALVDIAGTRTYLAVPLRRDDRLLGAFTIYRREVRSFTAKQIALAENFAAQAVIAMENARLITETREALDQQTATAEVLQVINSSPGDLAPVFDAMLEKAMRLCEAAFGEIHPFEEGRFHTTALRGASVEYAEARSKNPPRAEPGTISARVLETKRTVQVPDLMAEEAYEAGYPSRRVLVDIGGARTALAVPLLKEKAVLGYILIYRQQVRPFAEKQIALLENFAAQAVIAIENTRLIAETREALEQQTATAEVLQVINSSPGDLAPVFDAMLEKAIHLCEAAYGVLWTYDGQQMSPSAVHGNPEIAAALRALGPLLPAEGTLPARLLGGERVVHVSNAEDDQSYRAGSPARRALVEIGKARTLLGVALRQDDHILGLFTVYRQEVRPFTDKQISLLENFAAQAVIAMENARLITETREALDQQTATAEVLRVINSSPGDLVPVFDAMLERAVRLCEAASGIFWTYHGTGFRAMALHGVPDALVKAMRDTPRRMPTASLARIAAGEDVVRDDNLHQNAGAERAIQLGGMRTGFLVALKKGDVLMGAIRIFRQDPRPFADKQIALVQNFAAQAVIAMENARLITETQQRTVELQEALAYQTATGEVLRIVASSPDRLAPVLDAILERATELCGVKAGNLYLHEDGVFRAVAARHPDPEMVASMLGEPRRPGPGTAIHRAFSTRMPVHIPDIADDTAYGSGNPFRMRMVERGVRAVLIVPLVRGDEAIGAVTIYRPAPEAYTEAQIELVRTFADQAVVAIENARLFGELRAARDAAEAAYRDLQTAQSSLVQAQKMAALGQLTAGIAHEIKNPLNFVNNFAGLSTELLDELKEDMAPALAGLDGGKREAIDETIAMLTGNLDKIAEHGRRADNIVKSMLEHSRGVSGEKRAVDLNALIDEALNLAFHGARAQDQSFNITLERDYAKALGPVELAPQEMTRVFLNLFGNGFYAAHKRAQQPAPAKGGGNAYRPTLRVATRDAGNTVEITIRDNGTGIPPDIRDKLFQPFFTTKPTGEGTGLGLSISYDIVTQQHGGTIAVASDEGAYTQFTIRLPRG